MRTKEKLDLVRLTRQLVDIESTTFHENAIGRFLADFLERRGFQVERMPVHQADPEASEKPQERFNIYASFGEQPDVVLSTHMDTVPPYFPSREDEDYVYGRGACDAKGIIAAQIAAAEQLHADGVKAGLLFLVGEERDSAGAAEANLHPKGSRFLINGEPTENRLAIASKGSLRIEITAHGKMAHSAYPELGESATEKLVRALNRVLDIPLPVVDNVGPSTLNIGLIHGGRAPNVVADEARAHLLIRLVGPSEEIRREVEQAVDGLAEVNYTLEIPFIRMKQIEGMPTMVAAFTTDVPALSGWGEPLLVGPGSIHVAHTEAERLRKRDLVAAVDLYAEIARKLLEPR